eukprot:TRINITY_DN8119_c0_g1_i2.p1 TRINITY_DN8119_c0_g1~~TRINITY_DN8119_c0_g1_i2.p1  ORF type:complete len:730 (+),score=212.13 TRINITY_DN8119_c0_g1_i2:114-2303(+)
MDISEEGLNSHNTTPRMKESKAKIGRVVASDGEESDLENASVVSDLDGDLGREEDRESDQIHEEDREEDGEQEEEEEAEVEENEDEDDGNEDHDEDEEDGSDDEEHNDEDEDDEDDEDEDDDDDDSEDDGGEDDVEDDGDEEDSDSESADDDEDEEEDEDGDIDRDEVVLRPKKAKSGPLERRRKRDGDEDLEEDGDLQDADLQDMDEDVDDDDEDVEIAEDDQDEKIKTLALKAPAHAAKRESDCSDTVVQDTSQSVDRSITVGQDPLKGPQIVARDQSQSKDLPVDDTSRVEKKEASERLKDSVDENETSDLNAKGLEAVQGTKQVDDQMESSNIDDELEMLSNYPLDVHISDANQQSQLAKEQAKVFEGDNIHMNQSGRKLCSFSKRQCLQNRIEGYGFCIKHILEDPAAPFIRCEYLSEKYPKTSVGRKQCANPIAKKDDMERPAYCTIHKQAINRHAEAAKAVPLIPDLNTSKMAKLVQSKGPKLEEPLKMLIPSKTIKVVKKKKDEVSKGLMSHDSLLPVSLNPVEHRIQSSYGRPVTPPNEADAESSDTLSERSISSDIVNPENFADDLEFSRGDVVTEEEYLAMRQTKLMQLFRLYRSQYERLRKRLVDRHHQLAREHDFLNEQLDNITQDNDPIYRLGRRISSLPSQGDKDLALAELNALDECVKSTQKRLCAHVETETGINCPCPVLLFSAYCRHRKIHNSSSFHLQMYASSILDRKQQ